MKTLRLALLFAALLALSVAAAGCGSNKSSSGSTSSGSSSSGSSGFKTVYTASYDNGSAQKGGVYRVGWEQSFGFTNNFDPTGEYLGNAWGLYSNLMLRPLVGYWHLPGAAGNKLMATSPNRSPRPRTTGSPTPTSSGAASSSGRRSTVRSPRRTWPGR